MPCSRGGLGCPDTPLNADAQGAAPAIARSRRTSSHRLVPCFTSTMSFHGLKVCGSPVVSHFSHSICSHSGDSFQPSLLDAWGDPWTGISHVTQTCQGAAAQFERMDSNSERKLSWSTALRQHHKLPGLGHEGNKRCCELHCCHSKTLPRPP